MKSFTLIVVVAQAMLLQTTYAQCLRTCGNVLAAAPTLGSCCGGPVVSSAPVMSGIPTTIVQQSVANTLADTLSLLTVSSLLAETLPLSPAVCGMPIAPAVSYGGRGYGCGCGYGCGSGCGSGCGCGPSVGYSIMI